MKPINKADIRQRRLETTRQRADAFFGIYYEMGPDRSLEKLHGFCARIGLTRALNTFKRWSAIYSWQNKILEIDSQAKEEREGKRLAKITEMNERQAQDFRNAQTLARAGMSSMANELKRSGTLNLSPLEIIALLEKGAKGERLAMGEATERFEAMIYVYNVMVLAVLAVFKEINPMKDEIQRFHAFTTKVDELRHTKLIDYAEPADAT